MSVCTGLDKCFLQFGSDNKSRKTLYLSDIKMFEIKTALSQLLLKMVLKRGLEKKRVKTRAKITSLISNNLLITPQGSLLYLLGCDGSGFHFKTYRERRKIPTERKSETLQMRVSSTNILNNSVSTDCENSGICFEKLFVDHSSLFNETVHKAG